MLVQDIKNYTESLKARELELIDKNKSLIDFIDDTEKQANQNVDLILRKYEKYQV